jgi:aquaporin Z
VFTAVLVFAVLSTTHRHFTTAQGGLVVGLALTLIHLVTIPVDNTSVNPARSIATAIFAGTDAMKQLWAFVVFPIVGAFVGVLVWVAVDDAKLEDTMLGEVIDELTD